MFAGREQFGRVVARRRWCCWVLGAAIVLVVLAGGCGDGDSRSTEPPVTEPPSGGGEPLVEPGRWFPGLGRLDAPDGVFTDVAVSTLASCGIREGKELVCWGDEHWVSGWGFVVLGAPVEGEFSKVVLWSGVSDGPGYRPWYDGYIGGEHACGLRSDGVVVCWGQPFNGLGDAVVVGSHVNPRGERRDLRWELRSGPDQAPEGFVDISAGPGGVCGIRGDGTAACWTGSGWSDYDVLWSGFGVFEDRLVQVVVDDEVCGLGVGGAFECAGGAIPVTPPKGAFVDVSIGPGYGCGVRINSELVCWGDNEHGQADPPDGRYTAVFAGLGGACALDTGKRAVCWGDYFNPTEVGDWTEVPAGEFTHLSSRGGCGLRPDGEQVCWGGYVPPQIAADVVQLCETRNGEQVCWDADRSMAYRDSWDLASSRGDGQLAHIAAIPGVLCGLRPDNTAGCWTIPSANTQRFSPLDAPDGEFARLFNAWPWNTRNGPEFCGLRLDQTVTCWRYIFVFQESPPKVELHTSIPAGRFVDIDGKGRCGISADTSEIICWASFMTGLVGAPPSSVLPLARVSTGNKMFCGVSAADRSLNCWPHDRQEINPLGNSFDGEHLDVSVAPNGALCAIRVAQSLTCQGEFAELGWTDDKPSIAPDGEFTQVAVGHHHACAIRIDGTAVCWGHEHDGTKASDFYLVDPKVEIEPGDY